MSFSLGLSPDLHKIIFPSENITEEKNDKKSQNDGTKEKSDKKSQNDRTKEKININDNSLVIRSSNALEDFY